MLATLMRLRASDQGATAIEYGLIVAMIAVASASAFSLLGGGVGGMWSTVSTRTTGVL